MGKYIFQPLVFRKYSNFPGCTNTTKPRKRRKVSENLSKTVWVPSLHMAMLLLAQHVLGLLQAPHTPLLRTSEEDLQPPGDGVRVQSPKLKWTKTYVYHRFADWM